MLTNLSPCTMNADRSIAVAESRVIKASAFERHDRPTGTQRLSRERHDSHDRD
jgi:hypothetical protein